ncbi:MAG: Glutamate 5-kinase / RNA-binding C-terminal domain PUA, partial [uncultured Chloroflexia bacterium]
RWLLAETVRDSRVVIDEGATRALVHEGRSLLAAGIKSVEGTFARGQTVRIFAEDGRELARGITQYNVQALLQIKGHRSSEIQQILGYLYRPEVIHRNDLVMLS